MVWEQICCYFPMQPGEGSQSFSFITSLLNLNVCWLHQLKWNTHKFLSALECNFGSICCWFYSHYKLWCNVRIRLSGTLLHPANKLNWTNVHEGPTVVYCPAVPHVRLFVCLNLLQLVSLGLGDRGKKQTIYFKKSDRSVADKAATERKMTSMRGSADKKGRKAEG